MSESARIAVYTGSFDPVTLGHLNVIRRSSQLVDRLIVGIGINFEKTTLFTPQERIEFVQRVTANLDNIEVRSFTGLAVHFVRQQGARVMIRGLRPLTDIASEITMLMANRQLDHDIETIFLMADSNLAHVSSSLIKQITPLADDTMLSKFLPAEIVADVRARVEQENQPDGLG
ncbi:MAG TPA: pantetheine-phosphate adenylyltransferase [Planctomycetaceae bacterium]|nr:pantetheine-phosphate adenylyltransferase [Planctomycetaceae bacterium]